MKKSDFYYDLPKELIAQSAMKPRHKSRLLYYNRKTKEHKDQHFYNILDYFKKGDVLVINTTKVLKARLFCNREGKNERIEVLLNKKLQDDLWEVVSKPAKKLKVGTVLIFSNKLKAVVEGLGEYGVRNIRFSYTGDFYSLIDQIGVMPLPLYIKKDLKDESDYQTIYSNEIGSSAAPTAGLHFTDEIIAQLKEKGVEIVNILLHVGLGTFRPVKVENIKDHKMHSEYYNISKKAALVINKAKKENRRIIAVGTTTVRVLETVGKEGIVKADSGYTDIFIYPPYNFKIVDALITNFHLPESTLLMLVSAFSDKDSILSLYNHAVKEKYRFFSFGDAMYIE